jgi:hypothetical protein
MSNATLMDLIRRKIANTTARQFEVSMLGNATYGKTGESGPALNTEEYFALRALERTSPNSPLENNIRIAKLRPGNIRRLRNMVAQ